MRTFNKLDKIKLINILILICIVVVFGALVYCLVLNFSTKFVPPGNLGITEPLVDYYNEWETDIAIPVRRRINLIVSICSLGVLGILGLMKVNSILRNKQGKF